MKTIYIPWFWNNDDVIFQNYLNSDWEIIQLNLRDIPSEKVSSFIEWKNFDNFFTILKSHYPDIDENILLNIIENWTNFKWFTRKISLTISLTNKRISKIIEWWEKLRIVWHSQWWLITIKTIIENPQLLNNIEEIELLSPVIDNKTWWDFHSWKESWYLNWKWVIVRSEYIWELKWENNILYELLELLKEINWWWKLKLLIWKKDKVIPIYKFDISKIKEKYPKINLKIVEWDHYLWFKKKWDTKNNTNL